MHYPEEMPSEAWGLILSLIRGKVPTDPSERHEAVHTVYETTGFILGKVYPYPMPMGAAVAAAVEAPVSLEESRAYVVAACEARSGGMKSASAAGVGAIDWKKWLPMILNLLLLFAGDKK